MTRNLGKSGLEVSALGVGTATVDEHDLALLCRGPLAMGLLTGRMTAQTRLPDDDVRGKSPEWMRFFVDGRPSPEFLAGREPVAQVPTSGEVESILRG